MIDAAEGVRRFIHVRSRRERRQREEHRADRVPAVTTSVNVDLKGAEKALAESGELSRTSRSGRATARPCRRGCRTADHQDRVVQTRYRWELGWKHHHEGRSDRVRRTLEFIDVHNPTKVEIEEGLGFGSGKVRGSASTSHGNGPSRHHPAVKPTPDGRWEYHAL